MTPMTPMTPLYERQRQNADLRRVFRVKQLPADNVVPLGPQLIGLFDGVIAKRQTKLAKIAEVWMALVPEMFNEHCGLQSFVRGTLTVVIDSGSHLFALKQLLLAGLQQQLLLAGRAGGLRKIVLRAGRMDEPSSRPLTGAARNTPGMRLRQ